MRRPLQIALTPRVTPEVVESVAPTGEIVACDFYVEGIEQGEETAGGYRRGRIFNVDHHAPTLRMQRAVSSANLALAAVEAGFDPDQRNEFVVLNHNDCDSILSGGIMSGSLEAKPAYGDAAIAADHTGEENPIADLLQAIDRVTSSDPTPDLNVSYRNLDLLERNRPLDKSVLEAVEQRQRERAQAEMVVSRGRIHRVGKLSYAVLDEAIGGEFFPALLPDAAVILLMNPLPQNPARWQVKLRLGKAAPDGLTLVSFGVGSFDPAYGGRWNAGSNRRGGGTVLTPDDYASRIAERVAVQIDRLQ